MLHKSSHFDATDETIAKLSLGDIVRVVVEGEVTELTASRENEFDNDPPRFPAQVTIHQASVVLSKVDTEQREGLAHMFDEEE